MIRGRIRSLQGQIDNFRRLLESVSANMDKVEINLAELKMAVDGLLDHIIKNLGVEKVTIEEKEDFYWDCPSPAMYDTSKKPSGELDVGRLSDDLGFLRQMLRDEGYVGYMLVHAAPLLQYVAEKVNECGPQNAESPKAN